MKRPLWQIQTAIETDYMKYLQECTGYVGTPPITAGDVFHFLLVKGFIQGKKFYDYIDALPDLKFMDSVKMGIFFPLQEGHIPMAIRIGRKTNEQRMERSEGDDPEGADRML